MDYSESIDCMRDDTLLKKKNLPIGLGFAAKKPGRRRREPHSCLGGCFGECLGANRTLITRQPLLEQSAGLAEVLAGCGLGSAGVRGSAVGWVSWSVVCTTSHTLLDR